MNRINLIKRVFIYITLISISLTGVSAIEAENALDKVLNDVGQYKITTQTISNANNNKFITLYNKGDQARFKISVKNEGLYNIGLRVRSGTPHRRGVEEDTNNRTVYIHNNAYKIKINNKNYTFNGNDNSISALKDWMYWGTMNSTTKVYLHAGENFIDITANNNWLAVDSISLKNTDSTTVIPPEQVINQSVFEAEDTFSIISDLGNYSPIRKSHIETASNKKYISIFDKGDKIRLHFNVSKNGTYTLRLRVRAGWIKSSNYYVTLDNSNVLPSSTYDKSSNSGSAGYIWSDLVYKNITLIAGRHSIEVLAKSYWQMVDVLKVNMINEESDTSDTTAPIITIKGNNPILVEQGNNYTDAGAIATDNIDGTIPVEIDNPVDTNTIGTYIVKYRATDNANNTSTLTRTVKVQKNSSAEESTNEVTIIGSNKKYSSISNAIDAAESGDKIIIGSGIYNESLVINKNISIIGKNGATISGEQKIINWQYDNSKDLYYAPSPCGRVDFLFANGIKQKPAFFPEDGYISGNTNNAKDFYLDNKSYKRVSIFKKNSKNITMPNDLAGTLAVMHFRPWERSASYVSSVNGSSVTMEKASVFGGSDFKGLSFAYVVSSIKNVGEWGISKNKIYIKANSEPENMTTTCKEDAILIEGNAHKVTIDNLDITKFKGYGIRFAGKIASAPSNTDRVLKSEDEIIIKNSKLNYIGVSAIALRSKNEERNAKIEISNNEIDHVLATGIALYNIYGATIHHNYLHEIGSENYGEELVSRNSWGVGTAMQLDTTSKAHIYKNHLKNLGYIGINITHWGGVPVGGRVIEYNFIENVIQSLNDGGGIYRYGGMDSDKQFGWDKILNNIVLNSNGYIGFSKEDIHFQGAGIYTDNKSNYVEIANNTIVKSGHGLYYHENRYINGHHNTLVDGQWASFTIYQGETNVETKFNNNIVINSNSNDGWKTISYPGVGLSESDNNIYRTYDNTALSGKTLDEWIASYGFDGNSQVLTNKTNKPTILINTTDNKLLFNNLDSCKNVDDTPIGDSSTINSYNSLVLFDCTNYTPGTYKKSK
jgi:hypothetical protein